MRAGTQGQPQVFQLLDGLVERWCDRRDLAALRVLLQACPLDEPRIVQARVQPTAVIRLTIPRAEIRNVMGPAIAPDLWECYVAGPESNPDPATWRTELNRPLTR